MTDSAMKGLQPQLRSHPTTDLVNAGLKRRYRAERMFKMYGIIALTIAVGMLALLFVSIGSKALPAFVQTFVTIDVQLDEETIDPSGTRDFQVLSTANYQALIRQSLREEFSDVTGRRNLRELYRLYSAGAPFVLRQMVVADPALIGSTVTVSFPVSADIDQLAKGSISRDVPESDRRVSDQQIKWFDQLVEQGQIERRFNVAFFTQGDSREPELAGIWGAVVGSFYALVITLVLSFPIGVASAVYLEEFAPKNRLTDIIEVNINNLAAVPSIVFGLLGLAMFLNFFGLPRSAPLVGGLVLSLMTLPTVIIASRAALMSVPPSIREAALGLGASKLQVIAHHVIPLAMPGMMTGTIIGMARALGESAPLLMIGMVAFIVDIPQGPTDPATALPVQIFLWADAPERAFVERTSAAVMVLLGFLIVMNGLAVWLRNKFEQRW
jgi:phosphate transport system permease protein